MNNNSWTTEVKEDPNTGEYLLEFPQEMLTEVGWKEGDTLDWKDNKDGSFTLTKVEQKQWVLVEAISTFRTRYMVEVPVGIDDYGNNKKDWALDTVTMEDAKEFSQLHLGDHIVSHRVVTKEEALVICDQDNEYGSTWDTALKIENFFTKWEEQKQ
jgi:hypothetical protein